jgi:hypothetical protein
MREVWQSKVLTMDSLLPLSPDRRILIDGWAANSATALIVQTMSLSSMTSVVNMSD